MVKAVPAGLHAVTPQLDIDGCAQAIEWYKKAFGAEETGVRAPDPSGKKIWHSELRIRDSIFFVNDVFPDMGGRPSAATLWLYSEHVDAAWRRAVDAGATVKMPLMDMFWGDRMGGVLDPYGNTWMLAQRTRDMTPDEMARAQAEFLASMPRR